MDSHTQPILQSYESTENALLDSFKSAAVKVTNLYKDSLAQNRRAYGAGYQQAFQDLYGFINSNPDLVVRPNNSNKTYFSVEDLLEFARQRTTQVQCELGIDESQQSQQSQQQQQQQQQASISSQHHNQQAPSQTQSHRAGLDKLEVYPEQPQPPQPAAQVAPFHIDPNAQFTFIPPPNNAMAPWNFMPQQQTQQQENYGDYVKRKFASPEITFMGRSLGNMNVDGWGEPPLKRGRPPKGDD
ncbi:hypothetical protein BCR43DRAFT_487649 [Syncephalastrum racemosum]|uniref:Uncharacterized protein n=1 Tax=Syncephalastrum racemosum TaxID=13706 RepID=A0A1X2HHH0_SYNRA|nr:hypothetical protein BCR43DRAFT_487649 [Syncephalastrum racemosum]